MRDGKGVFLALDWAKIFDSISPATMAWALERFGCPSKLVLVMMEVYKRRTFVVHDNGYCSKKRSQQYGICQGCPLSRFIFKIVMTVLLHDAKEVFENMQGIVHGTFVVQDLVYADDTLLIVLMEIEYRDIREALFSWVKSMVYNKTGRRSMLYLVG